MSDRQQWDAVFVINQCSPEALVAQKAGLILARSVLLIGSHHFFKSERKKWTDLLGCEKIGFISFADLLDDEAMANIDAECSFDLRYASGTADYVTLYQNKMLARKNQAVAENLAKLHCWHRAWCDYNLGLWPAAWRAFNTTPLRVWQTNWTRLKTHLRKCISTLRKVSPPTTVRLLKASDTNELYAFVSSTRRLALNPAIPLIELPLKNVLAMPGPVFVATTLHEYPRFASRLGRPVRVFADGLLPSNYPRSYIDGYGDSVFIPADPFAERWFISCGKKCARTPALWTHRPLADPVNPTLIRKVLVLLGHAGDWCALVNRSDTDVLAEAFIELAAKYKNIDFILRPHPTMNHPQHEGAGAVERIQAEISQADLPNLSCSQMTLAEDLQVADLTVSEYSATLVDAWRSGRPGLIVNLTKRRSFMEDYERLGFLAVQNRESLAQFFSQLDKSVADLINRQATAVQHYNMLLKNFNTP